MFPKSLLSLPWLSIQKFAFIAMVILSPATALLSPVVAAARDWSIPVAGNVFRIDSTSGRNGIERDGSLSLRDTTSVYSIYFRVDRPAVLDLAVKALATDEVGTLMAKIDTQEMPVEIMSNEFASHALGQVNVDKAGYVRVDVQMTRLVGRGDLQVRELLVSSDTKDLAVDFVKNNDGNMFYWGRRGPSVHLRYEVPKDSTIEYSYSEITVPEGQDPIGSYYMANGFGEGYFGIQVNGPEERRVLFSVWSPFSTDDPKAIPEDQRIIALGRGPEVKIGEFGNEGSGGQSYLIYPWKAGKTYRFLTQVKPDGEGNTVYTSWFGDKEADEWRLIASFQRPKTNTHLRGFHSFLESFDPSLGHIGRKGLYGNVWVRDLEGQWHECVKARFSVDATGSGRHRLDFTGGAEGASFFMQNCGFFDETGRPGDVFTRESTEGQKPEIDLSALPRK